MKKVFYTLMFLIMGCISSFAANVLKLAGTGGTDVQIIPGEENLLEVVLNNDVPVTSLQFDVTLPDGLTFVENSQLRVTNRVTRASHDFYTVKQSTGAYRFVLFGKAPTMEKSVIKGNSGAIVTFKVKADIDYKGDVIKVTEIIGSNGTDLEHQKVNMEDQNIKADVCAADAGLEAEAITLTPGKSGIVNVTLANHISLAGLQATVTLPEGVHFVEGKDGEYVDYSNRLSANISAMLEPIASKPNTYQLLISSLTNDEFEGTEGVLFGLNVAADQTFQNGNVVISDIKVSSARGNAYSVKDVLTCGITQFTDPTLDGVWDIEDVNAIRDVILNGVENPFVDVDHNGVVDVEDINFAYDKILKSVTK